MPLSVLEYLRHILDESNYILDRAQGLTKDEFKKGSTVKRAFVRSIEVIGEASKKVPDEFRKKYTMIDWKAMAGMRDKLVHDYLGVDYDLVWDVVMSKVPALKKEIERIISIEENA